MSQPARSGAAGAPRDPGGRPGGRQPFEHIRGAKLGLPPDGPGSLATFGRRAGAFAIDALRSALVASLFVSANPDLPGITSRLPGWWSLIPLSMMYIGGLLLAGKTLGQHLLGLRVVRVDRTAAVTPWRAIVRTALLVILIPAVIVDKDGRGMHDRVTDTAVING
jgi:uncharacterized RDD family membrane protein YckC